MGNTRLKHFQHVPNDLSQYITAPTQRWPKQDIMACSLTQIGPKQHIMAFAVRPNLTKFSPFPQWLLQVVGEASTYH